MPRCTPSTYVLLPFSKHHLPIFSNNTTLAHFEYAEPLMWWVVPPPVLNPQKSSCLHCQSDLHTQHSWFQVCSTQSTSCSKSINSASTYPSTIFAVLLSYSFALKRPSVPCTDSTLTTPKPIETGLGHNAASHSFFCPKAGKHEEPKVSTPSHQPQLLLICHSNIPAASHDRTQDGTDDGGEGVGGDDNDGDEASPSEPLDITNPDPNRLYPYDPNCPINVLTNRDLLSLANTWEEYNLAVVGPGRTVAHPQLDAIVSELRVRGILDQTNLA